MNQLVFLKHCFRRQFADWEDPLAYGLESRLVLTLHSTQKHGEGNGIPLQYSCLENPMDRGTWWATVHGVAQSRTRLKRLRAAAASATQIQDIQLKSY